MYAETLFTAAILVFAVLHPILSAADRVARGTGTGRKEFYCFFDPGTFVLPGKRG